MNLSQAKPWLLALGAVALSGAAYFYIGEHRRAAALAELAAAVEAQNVELARALLARGVSPNAKLKSGKTWLGAAIEKRDRAMVELLLGADADPNLAWSQGRDLTMTPLAAALTGHADPDYFGLVIAERLVAGGATVSASDAALRRALNAVFPWRRPQTGEAVSIERLIFLVEHGYPLEAPAPRDSLLSMAAFAGNLEAVRYLLSRGAQPMGGARPCREARCPIDGAPLHRVAERPAGALDQAIVEALVAAGADVDSPDQYGRTPLQLAERSKNQAMAAALLAAGAASAEQLAGRVAPEGRRTRAEAKKAPQRALYAGHPGDPKGSDERALLSAAGTELHAVIAYAGRSSTDNSADIEVSAQGKPVTLLLAAYYPVEWRLSIVRGTQVVKIVALGNEPQRVRGVPAGAELVVRSAKQHGSGKLERVYYTSDRDELRRVVDRITEISGVAPKTITARHQIDKVTVDGTTSNVEVAERPSVPGSPVTFAPKRHEGKLSSDGLTAYYCCAGASSTIHATRGYRRGKRYFEARLELPFLAREPVRWTNIGVAAEDEDIIEGKNSFIDFREHKRYHDGDVFGVAIDYEERVAYFRVNGKWVSGEPGSKRGLKLSSRGELFAAVSVASGHDSWTANFGATPFQSPLPEGYLPYSSN